MEYFKELNLIVVAAIVLLFVLEGAMFFFIYKTNKRITQFFRGKNGKNIEKVLEVEMKRMKKTEGDIRDIVENMRWIEGITRKSVHRVGVVRFNPFRGSLGGDQSFSIALLDNDNTGVVISSIHATSGTRVYAKPIDGGSSGYQLTDEEKEALKRAIGSK